MLQNDLIYKRKPLNITKIIVSFLIIALISLGCSSDDGGSSKKIDTTNYGYTDLGDGTVLDNKTNLIWFKDASAFEKMNWYNAMDMVAHLRSGEYGLSDGSEIGDWRLPTKEEWEEFFDYGYRKPPFSNAAGDGPWEEGDAFDNVQLLYHWSSTTTSADVNDAWMAILGSSGRTFTYFKTFKNGIVWPVRSGD